MTDDVIDGLIDVSETTQEIPYEKPEILETAPEPEEMLDSVFEEQMTPEEEYAQALSVVRKPPEMKIKAYGTELIVREDSMGVYAEGTIELTSRNHGCLAKWDKLRIGINRRWGKGIDGKVTVKDYFSFRLETIHGQDISFWTKSSVMPFQRAFDKFLTMRAEILKDVLESEKLKEAKNWER